MMKRDFRKGIFGQLHISWDRLEVLWAPRQPTTFSTKFLIMVAPLGVWVTWKPFIQGWDGNTSCLYIYIYIRIIIIIYIYIVYHTRYILLHSVNTVPAVALLGQKSPSSTAGSWNAPGRSIAVHMGFKWFSWVFMGFKRWFMWSSMFFFKWV